MGGLVEVLGASGALNFTPVSFGVYAKEPLSIGLSWRCAYSSHWSIRMKVYRNARIAGSQHCLYNVKKELDLGIR